jgi:hypothetical protein
MAWMIFLPGFSQQRKIISVPDIPGFYTLKCDLHMHTVFSDGSVWPDVRIAEAWLEGLDAIAITDHIEYRPHKKDIVTDFNRSYDIARPVANQQGILLVKGAEITRDMPPGHLNALFITDANRLDTAAYTDALMEAKKQGAFILWNHPGWKSQQPDTTLWWPEHSKLYEAGLINGIEVYNDGEFYPEALCWANEKGLAIFGNSDVHNPINLRYDFSKTHRPMTLVFAKERTLESLKEALFARHTVAWFDNTLAGPAEFLKPLFFASIEVRVLLRNNKLLVAEIKNNSDIDLDLESEELPLGFKSASKISIEARHVQTIRVETAGNNFDLLKSAGINYRVKNFWVSPNECLKVNLILQ